MNKGLRLEIDPGAGFCFGVDEAVKKAEQLLTEGKELYGVGAMVHNRQEVDRLAGLGLKTISHEELGRLKGTRVLFRAHGEAPSSYQLASDNNLEVIDATCPIVLKLQKRIRQAYNDMDHEREQLVIFGKPGHPETIGLLGQVRGDALVLSSAGDASRVDPAKKVILYSQTTMDPGEYGRLEKALEPLLARRSDGRSRSHCGICGQMKNRKPLLRQFAEKHEVIVFVSGRDSSNGRMLYEYSRGINPQTYWISAPSDLDPGWFQGVASIGISGATSTSLEQLESIRNQIEKLIST